MKQRIWQKAISITLVLCLVITLIPDIGYATDTSTSEEPASILEPEGTGEPDVIETATDPEEPDEEVLEAVNDPAMDGFKEDDVIEKTATTTTYDIGDGLNAKVFHGGEVRFENEEGELVDYDPSLVQIKDGEKSDDDTSLKGYEYRNKTGDKKQYLPENLSEKTPVIMEYDGKQITITPTDDTVRELGIDQSTVSVENEIVPTLYEGEGESVPVNAVYGDEDDSAVFTYTSGDAGIKETLTLNKKPETNIFTYELYAGDLIVKENVLDEGITFIDPETEDIIAGIDAPWMNDATEEAFSTAIIYDLEKVAYEEGLYILTMTINEEYLSDEEREYPVTVDPTVTWKGNDEIRDTYIITGSGYAGTNFYETSNTKMPVGTNSTGRHRSLFKILNLKSEIEGMSVESAKLTLYESGTGASGQTIRANRLIEDWSPSTVTWNNQPEWNTSAYTAQVTTSGTKNTAKVFDCTAFAKNVSNGTSNYGLILRNMTTDPSYACFWGSRYATTAYRPKLVVTYHEKPTAPSSVSVHRSSSSSSTGYIDTSYFGEGRGVYASWEGIESYELDSVQYRFTAYDSNTTAPTSIGDSGVDLTQYRSIGTASSSADYVYASYSKYLPEGKYKLYIRGKDSAGNVGPAKYKVVTYDWTDPDFEASISPSAVNESSYTSDSTPTVTWDVSDTNFSKVTITVDGGKAVKLTEKQGEGSYKLSAGKLTTAGKHTIKLTATDKAGNTAVESFDYYLDTDVPEITAFETVPESTPANPSGNRTPAISWKVEEDNINKISFCIHEIDDQGNTVNKIAVHETSENEGTYQFGNDVFETSDIYTLEMNVTDKVGNETSRLLKYYVDITGPDINTFDIEPETSVLNKSENKSPIISWDISDAGIDDIPSDFTVYYSIDNSTWYEAGTNENGSIALPSSTWNADEGTFNIYLKAVDAAGNSSEVINDTYYLKAGNNYAAKNLAAAEYYGKRVLTWDFDAFDESIYQYDIHRSTAAGFTPTTATLLEADIDAKNKLYIDKEVLTEGTYYYKLVTKHRTSGNQAISGEVSIVNKFSVDDLKNTLGSKDYLSYTSFELPVGTAYIEESSGNLMYQHDDFTISNVKLDYGMSRTYNSQSDMTSMVGAGWTDSYHKEIYTAGNDVYFRDSDGSSYLFKNTNATYSCAETTEYTLTEDYDGYIITSKDDVKYTFNHFGQLVKTSEPNECAVMNVYDKKGRLSAIKSRTDSQSGKFAKTRLVFHYTGESMFLENVEDLAGTNYQYSFDGSILEKVTAESPDLDVLSGNYPSVSFEYGYNAQDRLTVIKDGMSNAYSFEYSNDKVSKAIYPDGENIQWTYDSLDTETGKTIIKKFTPDETEILSETTEFEKTTGKITKHVDPKEVQTVYEYDGKCPYYVTSETVKKEYQTISEDSTINLHVSHDFVTEYGYTDDASINLQTVTEPDGTVTAYEYNGQDQIVSETVTDNGTEISHEEYKYDSNGNLKSTYDVLEKTQSVSLYDEDGNEEASFEFNNVGSEIAVSNTATVESLEQVTAGTEVSKTETEYDEYGNADLIETETPVTEEVTVKEYDKMGRETYSKEFGTVTKTTYDYLGRTVSVTVTEDDLDPVTTNYSYNKNNSLVNESVESGIRKAYEFDNRNRVTLEETSGNDIKTRKKKTYYGYSKNVSIKEAGGGSRVENVCYTETVYDTDSRGAVSKKYIDNTGNTVKEDIEKWYTDYTYDKSGNCIMTLTCENGSMLYSTSLSLYDVSGNNTANIDYPTESDGRLFVDTYTNVTKMTYDGKGNMMTSVDGEGILTEITYDEKNRIKTCNIDEGNAELFVDYLDNEDDGSVVITTTDAEGHTNIETVDAAGNTTGTVDVISGGDTDIVNGYVYDKLGRKVSDEFSDWSYIEYSYVGDTDKISQKKAVNASGETEAIIDYEYDGKGQVVSVSRKSDESAAEFVKTQYTYDCEGKVLTETTYNGDKENVIIYTYDCEGRVASKKYPEDTGLGTLNFEYDSLGRCTAVKQGTKLLRSYIYNWFGGVSVINDYEKTGSSSYTKTIYIYDSLFRVSEMRTYSGETSTVLESHKYKYDRNDQIIEYTHVNNLTVDKIDEKRTYTYDTYGNLTKSVHTDNTDNTSKTTAYSYDKAGNRTSMTEDGVTTTYGYNAADQLISQTANGATVNYTYDHRGNCIQESGNGKTTTMAYSVFGEMTEWSDGTLTQTDLYDYNGQRIKRTEGSDMDYYFYENGVVSVIEDSSGVTAANVLTNEGGIVGSFRGNTYHNYLTDVQGSTTNIIKEDGTLSAAYDYTDFGETTELTGNGFDNQICYTGGIYDKETGLYYLNARYYDPEIGRFISQDSYRGELNDPGQWHLYAYCANNPINYVDPSGHARNTKNKKYYSTVKTFYFTPKTSYKVYISFTLTIYWTVKNGKIYKSNISETLYGKYKVNPRRHVWRAKRFYRDITISNNKKTAYYKAKIYIDNLYNWAASTSIRYKISLHSDGGRFWERQ